MNCPACNVSLLMSERSGVEIDYCPQCRGVWLDRGELDKIIERSAEETNYEGGKRYEREHRGSSHDASYQQKKHKKRDSFLDDLFDF
ncbi:MAG TPA: zf-TFIIB domain-containing protein [Candidatus Kapabacteria bacterium]|nr:zf-TFIIB domain-containing protein [Candidatus Kapabacteria bacterium]